MNNMKKIISIVCLLVVLITFFGISYAEMKPEADLDNFRGMKWGMDINKLPESDFVKTSGPSSKSEYFQRKSEDLDVLGVKATDIRYEFRNNQFYAVTIFFNISIKDELRESLIGYLGKPNKVERKDLSLYLTWKGNNVWISEVINFRNDFIFIYIHSFAATKAEVKNNELSIKDKIKKGF